MDQGRHFDAVERNFAGAEGAHGAGDFDAQLHRISRLAEHETVAVDRWRHAQERDVGIRLNCHTRDEEVMAHPQTDDGFRAVLTFFADQVKAYVAGGAVAGGAAAGAIRRIADRIPLAVGAKRRDAEAIRRHRAENFFEERQQLGALLSIGRDSADSAAQRIVARRHRVLKPGRVELELGRIVPLAEQAADQAKASDGRIERVGWESDFAAIDEFFHCALRHAFDQSGTGR